MAPELPACHSLEPNLFFYAGFTVYVFSFAFYRSVQYSFQSICHRCENTEKRNVKGTFLQNIKGTMTPKAFTVKESGACSGYC